MGWRRNALDGTRWRTDTDDDLRLGYACGEKENASGNGEEMLHGSISFIVLTIGGLFHSASWPTEIADCVFIFANSLMI
jgi:hypothetical protein